VVLQAEKVLPFVDGVFRPPPVSFVVLSTQPSSGPCRKQCIGNLLRHLYISFLLDVLSSDTLDEDKKSEMM
jgi:hypothetical protein